MPLWFLGLKDNDKENRTMPKRTIWFGMGATVGATAGLWTKHKIDRKIATSAPLRLTKRAISSSAAFTRDLKQAVKAGSKEKREVEMQLKNKFTPGSKAFSANFNNTSDLKNLNRTR